MKKLLLLMLLCLVQAAVYAQDNSVTVKGVVQDNKGEAIMGAVVIVKNQPGLGSSTDIMVDSRLRPENSRFWK